MGSRSEEDKISDNDLHLHWPRAEPDEIEREVIRVISAIPEQPGNWIDPRSRARRFFERRREYLYEDKVFMQHMRDLPIKERWTKEIVIRLVELGKRLGFEVNDSHNVTEWRGNWMYDVVWRAVQIDEAWVTTHGLPLVLECTWSESFTGRPSLSVVDRLLLSRAQRRVMVCQGYAGALTFEEMAARVDACDMTQTGDRYLLLHFNGRTKQFESWVYVGKSSCLIKRNA